jgi:hypothetical protein
MALICMDGFDFVDPTIPAASGALIQAALQSDGWTASNDLRIAANPRFSRGTALEFKDDNRLLSRPIGSAVSNIHVGFAFRPETPSGSFTRFMSFRTSTTEKAYLAWTSADVIQLKTGTTVRATATVSIGMSIWRYVEVTYSPNTGSTGRCIIRINGVTVMDYTGITSSDTNTLDYVAFSNSNANSSVWGYFALDDVYIITDSGAAPTTHFGPIVVEGLTVSGAGSQSQWTASGGSNYQCVDEDYTPNSDTDYVSTGTAGNADTYAVDDVSTSLAVVLAVQTTIMVRKDDVPAHTIKHRIRISGSTYDGAAMPVGDTYAPLMTTWMTDPSTGGNWTASVINAAEFGFKMES